MVTSGGYKQAKAEEDRLLDEMRDRQFDAADQTLPAADRKRAESRLKTIEKRLAVLYDRLEEPIDE